MKVVNAPPRVYSHRFNIPTNQFDGPKPMTIFRRLKGPKHNSNEKNTKQPELFGSIEDNSLIGSGAILIAIVALSCSIILVLLGITVYMCGRRGICFRRNHLSPNPPNLHGTLKFPPDKIQWSTTLNSDLDNINQLVCQNDSQKFLSNSTGTIGPSMLVENESGTVLRCHLSSPNSEPDSHDNEYGDQNSIHHKIGISNNCDVYSKCVPHRLLKNSNTNYTVLPPNSILLPVLSNQGKNTNSNHCPLNHSQFYHQFYHHQNLYTHNHEWPNQLLNEKSNPDRNLRTFAQKTKTCNPKFELDLNLKQNSKENTNSNFTQSLKLKKMEHTLNDSSLSVSSTETTTEYQPNQGENHYKQMRSVKSWENLILPKDKVV